MNTLRAQMVRSILYSRFEPYDLVAFLLMAYHGWWLIAYAEVYQSVTAEGFLQLSGLIGIPMLITAVFGQVTMIFDNLKWRAKADMAALLLWLFLAITLWMGQSLQGPAYVVYFAFAAVQGITYLNTKAREHGFDRGVRTPVLRD